MVSLPGRQPAWRVAAAALLALGSIILPAGDSEAQRQRYRFTADLDPLINLPEAWNLTPQKLEKLFTAQGGRWDLYFNWLTKDKSRAFFSRRPYYNLTADLRLFGGKVPVEEVIVDFEDGKLVGMTVSVYNRGDAGGISEKEFQRRMQVSGEKIGQLLDIRPFRRSADPTQGALTEGWIWISGKGMAVLEHNPEAPGQIEFLRMRLARRDAKGAYAAAMRKRAGAAVKLSDLPRNVERDKKGNVFIGGIPMVDQGQKGYCVVATVQRLFEYYGIPCDQHQLAQIAEADPMRGTDPHVMREEISKIDHRFKTRFDTLAIAWGRYLREVRRDTLKDAMDVKDFKKLVRDHVDDGIPLLWGLVVGRFPEEPDISPQTSGGHMRMIIGYNEEKNRLIFSDSWGAGHEFKSMDFAHAYQATDGIFLLQPILR